MMVCGGKLLSPDCLSSPQTINDYFDRELDAINEPYRPIPSGLRLALACQWQLFTAVMQPSRPLLKLLCFREPGAISEPEVIAQFLTLLVAGLGVSYTLDR